MAHTKQQLLSCLQELQLDFDQYEHPVVMTVEAQAKFVGQGKGALSRNLFLKDKKHRYYIVSALADTIVDLKVLSQRLGLGKGGLRMAPEETLGEILQVPLGCVTPFALVNKSARHALLLLDQGFKVQERCIFHPLSNDMSISLNARDLDKFLNSIGKHPAYVDLEANPPVGKDQLPDLASLVPSDAMVLPDPPEKTAPEKDYVSSSSKSSMATGLQHACFRDGVDALCKTGKIAKTINSSSNSQKEKSSNVVKSPSSFTDPDKFVEEILEKASSVLLSQIKEENIKQHGEELGAVVTKYIRRQLTLELKNMTIMFKNTAYAEGFHAGSHLHSKCS